MEGGIEYQNLGNGRHDLRTALDTHQVGRGVKGSKVVTELQLLDDLGSHEAALEEVRAAMHHAVSYGIDFGVALYAALGRVGKDVEDGLDGAAVVDFAEVIHGFATVGLRYLMKPPSRPIFSTPPSASTSACLPSRSMSLYFTDELPELSTSIFIIAVSCQAFSPIAWLQVIIIVL